MKRNKLLLLLLLLVFTFSSCEKWCEDKFTIELTSTVNDDIQVKIVDKTTDNVVDSGKLKKLISTGFIVPIGRVYEIHFYTNYKEANENKYIQQETIRSDSSCDTVERTITL